MIQVIKTKPIKSTTKVEGIAVHTSDKKWYAITRMQPARFGWYLRCCPSTSTGRLSFGDEIYMYPTRGKAEFEEGIKELLAILNGEKEGRLEQPDYNRRY